ncbi:hypothetical protein AAFF_G00069010 [Aldrovandia affinis]|uniref:Uncharacterized protein n=1 Tax=Aldrovandia affinis TaxID=143900 RepID=A0AAD7WDG9_9TELE|nr:hypothetical protein AAFF_G00069010 [Aldrovandia affinis]
MTCVELSRVEITKATSDERHLLHGCHPPAQQLKSRRSFLSHVQPLTKSREETRIQLWMGKLENDPPPTVMGIPPTEDLPPGTVGSVENTQPPENENETVKSCSGRMGLQDWPNHL